MAGTSTASVDLLDLLEQALAATRATVAAIGPADWDARVETAGTTVRGLVNHFVGECFWVGPLLDGEPAAEVRARFAGDLVGDDAVGVYDRAGAAALAAFRVPGALDRSIELRPGEPVSARSFCRDRFVDLVVHGWEVANAAGLHAELDPDLAESARAAIEPKIAELRANGVIKDALEVPDHASAQTRLLAYFGFVG